MVPRPGRRGDHHRQAEVPGEVADQVVRARAGPGSHRRPRQRGSRQRRRRAGRGAQPCGVDRLAGELGRRDAATRAARSGRGRSRRRSGREPAARRSSSWSASSPSSSSRPLTAGLNTATERPAAAAVRAITAATTVLPTSVPVPVTKTPSGSTDASASRIAAGRRLPGAVAHLRRGSARQQHQFIGRRDELAELERALGEADGMASRRWSSSRASPASARRGCWDELIDAAEAARRSRARRRLHRARRRRAPLRAAGRRAAAAAAQRRPGARRAPRRDARRARAPDPGARRAARRAGDRARRGPAPALRRVPRADLARSARSAPVLLWIEDIHWADRSTRSFLRFLAASLTGSGLLVVATYRSDELHRRHPLRPLLAELERSAARAADRAAALRPRRARRPARRHPRRGAGRRRRRAHATAAATATRCSPRSCSPRASTAAAPLPPSLREALLLRVERLPARDPAPAAPARRRRPRRPRSCSPRPPGSTPAELSARDPRGDRGADRRALDGAAGSASATRCCARCCTTTCCRASAPSSTWRSPARSSGGSRRATAAWTRDRDRPSLLLRGRPAAGAGVGASRPPRAVRRLHAYGEAAALLDRALELWPRVADPEELAGLDEAELLSRAGRRHYLAGDDEVGRGALRAARSRRSTRRPTPSARPRVLTALATCQWSLGLAERSRATQRRGLELLPADEDSPERARLLAQRVRFLLLQGRFREVREEAPEALEAVERAGLGRDVGVVNRLGCALFALGDEEGRAGAARRVDRARRATGTSDDLATAYLNYADALHIAGQSREARRWHAGPGEVSERVGTGVESLDALASGSTSPRSSSTSVDWAAADEQLAPAGHRRPRCGARPRRPPPRLSWRSGAGRARGGPQGARSRGRSAARTRSSRSTSRCSQPCAPSSSAAAATSIARWPRSTAASTGSSSAARTRVGWRWSPRPASSIAADAAERARDLGDATAEQAAVARAESLLELIRAAAEDGERPVERAGLATSEAELSRARGEDDPALWAEAAAGWERVERPYNRAIARWRQAQAELAAADRAAAAGVAR